jgi:murein tripeptide amidase MpaA
MGKSRLAVAGRALPIVAVLTLSACSGFGRAMSSIGEAIVRGANAGGIDASLPRTRAERSAYMETSTHADVLQFLDSLQKTGASIALGALGRSTEGREIPYAMVSRPLVRTPEEAHRLGRPVVYVQANIHAGEVEGKEALLALVRDLVAERAPNVLDSIVLVAVPIYNADGNERFAGQSRNREEQNGPEMVGERANGQNLDLNRDYIKAEAPETRASLAAFAAWDPDVFVDLHTTDGSFHGFALTYAPPLAPVGRAATFTRDSLLPVLRARMRARHQFETFDYGNFDGTYADAGVDTTTRSWKSYDHRPRFGTNYVGLRGRVAILSEAYSHDPFERRVKSTYAFVREILSLAAERNESLAALARTTASGPLPGTRIAIRARLTTTPFTAMVPAEELERTGDSSLTQPGVPRGERRTGRYRSLPLAIHDRFEPALEIELPAAYAIEPAHDEILRALVAHGIVVDRLRATVMVDASVFIVDSLVRSRRSFQGHFETRAFGHWTTERRALPSGTLVVPVAQSLGALAAYLLEPESDDGLVTWNTLDPFLRRGAEFPVVRVPLPLPAPSRALLRQ